MCIVPVLGHYWFRTVLVRAFCVGTVLGHLVATVWVPSLCASQNWANSVCRHRPSAAVLANRNWASYGQFRIACWPSRSTPEVWSRCPLSRVSAHSVAQLLAWFACWVHWVSWFAASSLIITSKDHRNRDVNAMEILKYYGIFNAKK